MYSLQLRFEIIHCCVQIEIDSVLLLIASTDMSSLQTNLVFFAFSCLSRFSLSTMSTLAVLVISLLIAVSATDGAVILFNAFQLRV